MKPILLVLILAACAPTPPNTVQGYQVADRTIEIQGAGITQVGAMVPETSYASSTGLCEPARVYIFRTEELALGFVASTADLTAALPTETDIDAPIASRVTLPDGRNGVLANGTAQLIDDGDTIQVTLTGSRWCELELDPVTERDVISTCADEEIEVSYTITIIDERGRLGFACTQEAGLVNDEGLCMSRADPVRCVGDPIPPPQD